jgi:predicted metal-dependent RNase
MKKNNGNGSDKNNYNKSFNRETKSELLDKNNKNNKYVKDEEAIINTIFECIPQESQITIARFEGPNIALYTKNPRFSLTELTYYLSSLSKNLKKRFVVRTDQSIRLQEEFYLKM